MKRRPEHELQTRWFSLTTSEGLIHVHDMVLENSSLLIHGAFEDELGGKCLASWFGHHLGISGPEFLRRATMPEVSEVVHAWDTDPAFPAQLLKALRREIFYRGGVRRGWAGRTSRDQSNRPSDLPRPRIVVGL